MHSELITAIALAWLVLAVYVVTLGRRQRKLTEEINRLKETLSHPR